MSLTLAEAAALVGCDKSTMRRAVSGPAGSQGCGPRQGPGSWRSARCGGAFPTLRAPWEPASAVKLHALGDAPPAADNRTTDVLVAELRGSDCRPAAGSGSLAHRSSSKPAAATASARARDPCGMVALAALDGVSLKLDTNREAVHSGIADRVIELVSPGTEAPRKRKPPTAETSRA